MQISSSLAPFMRGDLNPAFLTEKNGIIKYLNPQYLSGDNDKYRKLYDRLAPLYDFGERWIGFLKYGNTVAKMRRDMMQLLEWQNGANVLYVSIGTGKDFNYIPANVDAKSLQLIGADISMGMLRRAQKVWSRKLNLSLVQCAAEDLPFADNSFDIVFHVGGINFFTDKTRAIAEMLRVAKPKTLLMIADETQDFIENQYQKNALTKKAYQDAHFDLAEIENAIPDNARERKTHFLWDNRFYAMTFRKAKGVFAILKIPRPCRAKPAAGEGWGGGEQCCL